MSNTDNIDKFGHCVICHKNLIIKRVVDGQVVDMFLPIHDHTDFLLNNGSMMKVCICKICKSSVDLTDNKVQSDIMEACQKGWKLETEILVKDEKNPDWTEKSAKEYLDKMANLDIDVHADNLDKNILINKSQELAVRFREDNEVKK